MNMVCRRVVKGKQDAGLHVVKSAQNAGVVRMQDDML